MKKFCFYLDLDLSYTHFCKPGCIDQVHRPVCSRKLVNFMFQNLSAFNVRFLIVWGGGVVACSGGLHGYCAALCSGAGHWSSARALGMRSFECILTNRHHAAFCYLEKWMEAILLLSFIHALQILWKDSFNFSMFNFDM